MADELMKYEESDELYEEFQAVLATFPLVEEAQKKRCLQAYNDWMFSLKAVVDHIETIESYCTQCEITETTRRGQTLK